MFGGREKGDARIRGILDAKGINYTVDDDGDYRIIYGYESDRSQLVFINSKTHSFAGVEVREVWSVGLRGNGQLSASVANSLLERNGQYKIGSWEISKKDGQIFAIFKVTLSANAGSSELIPIVEMVGMQADEVEKEFLITDDL